MDNEDITRLVPGGPRHPDGSSDEVKAIEPPAGYTIEHILGRGAMGAVYLARRESDGRLVAIKIMDAALASRRRAVARFKREVALMLRLDHPNIVKAYDVGIWSDCHYVCMEYVRGETLAARIKREGQLDEAVALGMMRQIADALAYSARKGVVHRDLKPDNVYIREDGVCKLGDMGLALIAVSEGLRLTDDGMALGTPLYMSPEQASGIRDVDARADIYSFGCVFFHALCGRPPFDDEDAVRVMRAHLHNKPPRPRDLRPGLREDIEAVIVKCMEKHRDRRYRSAKELVGHIALIMAASGLQHTQATSARPKGSRAGGREKSSRPRRSTHEVLFPFGKRGSAPPPS